MKIRACLLVIGIAAAGSVVLPAAVKPATKTAPAPAPKEEPLGTIVGVETKRGDGYFGVALVNGNFQITFYDAKKKPVVSPFPRAALHWPVNYKQIDERTVLNLSGDGKTLTGGKVVRPPYVFKLFITFIAEGADESAGSETQVIDFRA